MTDQDRAIEQALVGSIRAGDSTAWQRLIDRYEGRLLAFASSRIGRVPAEDVVQDTFIGFLTSLPNYDAKRKLESYLFSICAYKLTDYLRREGRRPAIPMSTAFPSGSGGSVHPPSPGRGPSTIVRSVENKQQEERALSSVLSERIDHWKSRGEWTKLKCMELIFVRGMGNKQVAESLGLSEQKVANYKFDFLAHLRKKVRSEIISHD